MDQCDADANSPTPVAFTLSIFDQAVFWADPDGTHHLLTDLTQRDVESLIDYLIATRHHFFAAIVRRAVVLTILDDITGAPPAAKGTHTDEPAVWELTATQWLESTELMRALRHRAHQPPGHDA